MNIEDKIILTNDTAEYIESIKNLIAVLGNVNNNADTDVYVEHISELAALIDVVMEEYYSKIYDVDNEEYAEGAWGVNYGPQDNIFNNSYTSMNHMQPPIYAQIDNIEKNIKHAYCNDSGRNDIHECSKEVQHQEDIFITSFTDAQKSIIKSIDNTVNNIIDNKIIIGSKEPYLGKSTPIPIMSIKTIEMGNTRIYVTCDFIPDKSKPILMFTVELNPHISTQWVTETKILNEFKYEHNSVKLNNIVDMTKTLHGIACKIKGL